MVLFAIVLLATYLDARHRDARAALAGSVWAGAGAVSAPGLGQLLGGVIDRARPSDAMPDIHLLVARTTDFSFPSDHAIAAGAAAAGLLLANRRWGTVAAIAAVLMAAARVYLGAHYAGDVVAGLVLGSVVAAAGHRRIVLPLTTLVHRAGRTRLGVVLTGNRAS